VRRLTAIVAYGRNPKLNLSVSRRAISRERAEEIQAHRFGDGWYFPNGEVYKNK
jgi:hypothetical protein